MKKKNQDIRLYLKKNNVYQWEVADKLGIDEPALTKRLRYELSNDDKQKILLIIDEIIKERGE